MSSVSSTLYISIDTTFMATQSRETVPLNCMPLSGQPSLFPVLLKN